MLSLIFWIGGCSIVPKTSTGLVENSKTVESYCYDIEEQTVGTRITEYLSKCYGDAETVITVGSAYIPLPAGTQVIQEKLKNGMRYSFRTFSGFGYSANVFPEMEGCKTKVVMYGASSFWRSMFERVNQKIQGQDPSCPL